MWRHILTVSYLVSSYNKSEYLNSVLESVASELKQTGGDVLIVDDGSTDGSWATIEAFIKCDPRITARRQENRGIFNVTNQLIKAGAEKWMRIIDCDDPPILGSTALLVEIAERENADYVFGKTVPYGPEPLTSDKLLQFQEIPHKMEVIADPLKYAIREYNHVPSTALIQRSCIPPGTALNENFISCQDLALALPIFVNAKVLRIDVPVCHQLTGARKRLSANEALTWFQTIQIIKEFGNTRFDTKYKYMSARKHVSRALRWMRHHRMIGRWPLMYLKLLLLYGSLLVSNPLCWECYLESATQPYRKLIPAGRQIY